MGGDFILLVNPEYPRKVKVPMGPRHSKRQPNGKRNLMAAETKRLYAAGYRQKGDLYAEARSKL
jgi:hypothetical protein